jgi:trehalose synthase
MEKVEIVARSTSQFRGVLGTEHHRALDDALARLWELLAGRRLWHINSTSAGGGVAEMLASLLPYPLGAGVDVRWLVVNGDERFFEVTKRVHNHLHDDEGDNGSLGDGERAVYEQVIGGQADPLLDDIRPGDVVVLHDPQTAGLVVPLKTRGAHVVWRCHVGLEEPGSLAREAWEFLRYDVLAADACVFSRPQFVWDGLVPDRVVTLAPCIDVVSPKNQPLDRAGRDAILQASGIISADGVTADPPVFVASDGARQVVERRATLTEEIPLPADARVVLQVSRWDRLKDPVGLLQAFAIAGPTDSDVHLLLAGPAADGVADDPEGAETFADVCDEWRRLAPATRRRVHLVRVPMDDFDENAAIVNALQRRADVVVQKSLAEGFGLTVAEAMWKHRPVVASRVGGIQDQIVHDESGILVDDPCDLAAFGRAIREVLADPERARRMGSAAHDRVCASFLPPHYFAGEARLVEQLVGRG